MRSLRRSPVQGAIQPGGAGRSGRRGEGGAVRAPGATSSCRGRERGSATVLLLAVLCVALVLAVGTVALSRAASARGTAQAAADLAAVAAAQAQLSGTSAPCTTAADVVVANGAELTGCTVEGGFVEVTARVPVEPWRGWRTSASAVARAGPVGASP